MSDVYPIKQIVHGPAADRPAAGAIAEETLYIADDTGDQSLHRDGTWQAAGGGGASYPDVTADGLTPGGLSAAGQVAASTFTSISELADPTTPPTVTEIAADPGSGKPVVAAGTYRFGYILTGTYGSTALSPTASITTDGTHAIQIDVPSGAVVAPATSYGILTDNGVSFRAIQDFVYTNAVDVFPFLSPPVVPSYFHVLTPNDYLYNQFSAAQDYLGRNFDSPPAQIGQILTALIQCTGLQNNGLFSTDYGDISTDGIGNLTVLRAVIAGAYVLSVSNPFTADHAMAMDEKITVYVVNASGTTITLPDAAGQFNAGNVAGHVYTVKNGAAGTSTTVASAGGTIDGATTKTLASAYDVLRVVSDGTNWLVI